MPELHPHIAFQAGFQAGTAVKLAMLIHGAGARPMVTRLFANFADEARGIVNTTHAEAMVHTLLMEHARKTIRILESRPIVKHLSLKVLDRNWISPFTELFAATIGLINTIRAHPAAE